MPTRVKDVETLELQLQLARKIDTAVAGFGAWLVQLYLEGLEPATGSVIYQEIDSERTYKRQWELTDEGNIAFTSDPQQVEMVFQPVEGKAATSLKSVKRAGSELSGHAVVWGSEHQRDLEGEFFTKDTDFWLDHYGVGMPIFFQHTFGSLPGMEDTHLPEKFYLGTIKSARKDNVGLYIVADIERDGRKVDEAIKAVARVKGITDEDMAAWVQEQKDARAAWLDVVINLVDEGLMNWSSGAVSHLARSSPKGWLYSWPIAEASVTPTPAEPRMTDVTALRASFENFAGAGDRLMQYVKSVEGALSHQAPPTEGDNIMLTQEQKTALKALFAAKGASVKEALSSAVKAEDAEAFSRVLGPLAEEFGSSLNITRGVVQDELEALAHAMLSEEGDPDAEPAPVPVPADAPPAPAVDVDALAAAVAEKAAGLVIDQLPAGFKGQAKIGDVPNVNVLESKSPPFARFIKAVRDHDYAYLSRRGPRDKMAFKALGINPDTAGGYLVPPDYSNQMIEFLRARSLFMRDRGGGAGPLATLMPMNRDTLTIPKQTGGSSGAWLGENAQLTGTQPTFGNLVLVAKKYGILLKMSNELLEDSDPEVDTILMNDISRALANAVDSAVYEGTGAAAQPLGFVNRANYQAGGSYYTDLNAPPTYDNLVLAATTVEENVKEELDDSAGWVFHTSLKRALRELEDSNGNLVWASEGFGVTAVGREPSELIGWPWYATTLITKDTAHSNQSPMLFGRWRDLVIAMRKTIELRASDEAGTAFEYDQTWIRGIMRLDIAIRHEESFYLLDDAEPV